MFYRAVYNRGTLSRLYGFMTKFKGSNWEIQIINISVNVGV